MRFPEPPRNQADVIRWAAAVTRSIDAMIQSLESNKLTYQRFFKHRSVAEGLTAAGASQSTATEITADLVEVTSATADVSDGLVLPIARQGMQITIANRSAETVKVYPALGESIDALGANAALTVATTKVVVLTCMAGGKWYSLMGA
jgi:hypothetical protein